MSSVFQHEVRSSIMKMITENQRTDDQVARSGTGSQIMMFCVYFQKTGWRSGMYLRPDAKTGVGCSWLSYFPDIDI
jgi:hypothetical protein